MKVRLQPATLFHRKAFFLCGTRTLILGTIIFVGFQPHSEDVVRPRTRDEYEHQRNHNKPARYEAVQGQHFSKLSIPSQT